MSKKPGFFALGKRRSPVIQKPGFYQKISLTRHTLSKKPGFFALGKRRSPVIQKPGFYQKISLTRHTLSKKPGFFALENKGDRPWGGRADSDRI
ncbi:MAG: hypothetical protein F6J93_18835 [Oscillatoria sp. SIO1A7]|nr:hypothetical protein [Oscillatoria sp. SIO1A7]